MKKTLIIAAALAAISTAAFAADADIVTSLISSCCGGVAACCKQVMACCN